MSKTSIRLGWVAAPLVGAVLAACGLPSGARADLAIDAQKVLKTYCYECHGEKKIKSKLDLKIPEVVRDPKRQIVVAGKPDESKLLKRIEDKDDPMPPSDENKPVPEAARKVLRAWIAAGAPFPGGGGKGGNNPLPETGAKATVAEHPKDLPPGEDLPPAPDARPTPTVAPVVAAGAPIGEEYVLKVIADDASNILVRDRRFMRYFSMNHILAEQQLGGKIPSLEDEQRALAKAINHLSWQPQLVTPTLVDKRGGSVFRIDLRELGWDQTPFPKNKNLNLYDIVLLEYPYATFQRSSPVFDQLASNFLAVAEQARPIPYVRSDWFVSVATQSPLYESMLQIPTNLRALEATLGVDVEGDIQRGLAQRAGMAVSDVSNHNRVVERHRSRTGYYWLSYDFNGSNLEKNIARNPIDLHQAGGEVIFSLPNGLQAYALANSKGDRIAAGPQTIVIDKTTKDKVVRNAISCMRCHDKGMKEAPDIIRKTLLKLPANPVFDKDTALKLYVPQEQMDKSLQGDGERFRNALEKLFGKPQGAAEPVRVVSNVFQDGEISQARATSELGRASLGGLDQVARIPGFEFISPLADKDGQIRRDEWEENYPLLVRRLGAGVPLVAMDAVNGKDHTPPGTAIVVDLQARNALTNKPRNKFVPGDEVTFVVTNKSARPIHIEMMGTGVMGNRMMLVSQCQLAPGEEKRFPAKGGMPIKPLLGTERITVLASETAFPAGEVLQGKDVATQIFHRFNQLRQTQRGNEIADDAENVVMKSLIIETN